jgi:hypothetical protein
MAYSSIEIKCPRCHDDVRYDRWRGGWIGDNDISCLVGGNDSPNGHKDAIEGALVYALTMNGINGLIEMLAGNS